MCSKLHLKVWFSSGNSMSHTEKQISTADIDWVNESTKKELLGWSWVARSRKSRQANQNMTEIVHDVWKLRDAQGIRWASSWWGLALKSANLTGNKSWVWHPGPAWTDANRLIFMDSSYSTVVHRTHGLSSLQMEEMVCVYVLYSYGVGTFSWVAAFTQSFRQENSWLVSNHFSSSEMLISWPHARSITSIYSKNCLHIQEINSKWARLNHIIHKLSRQDLRW